ncbi:hypothetical protein HYV79_03885 [Candidatus Woesearchaeota archaeon]|nr:hypothetical protein [Candidatus Woesearchaeota archaeon]
MNKIPAEQKARILLKHLDRAKKKLNEREQTRIELDEALKRLRMLSTASLKKYVDQVEQKVQELLKKEKQLLYNQEKEESIHERLIEQLEALENKINDFLENSEERQQLFEKASKALLPPAPSVEEADVERIKLQGMLEGLELLYASLEESKELSAERLKKIKQQINMLKAKQNL